jgi:hypothetical protein
MKKINISIKCQCGKTTKFESHQGCFNIADAEKQTNWLYSTDTFTYQSIWLCTECAEKAQKLMIELLNIVKTRQYNFLMLVKRGE